MSTIKNYKAVACAIIEHKGKILIAQRSETMHLPLKWEFPGGKLEKGESVEECIVREINEELNLNITVLYRLKENSHTYKYSGIQLFPCVCALTGGTLHLREHVRVCWVSPSELHEYDLAEADIPVAAAYFNHIKERAEEKTG